MACWIGFNKGLRTVFMALAIPSHVPLDRLPGATGIQLLFSGVFYLLMGPLIGEWLMNSVCFYGRNRYGSLRALKSLRMGIANLGMSLRSVEFLAGHECGVKLAGRIASSRWMGLKFG